MAFQIRVTATCRLVNRYASHRGGRPQYPGTSVWTFAGKVPRDRGGSQEYLGALHGRSELHRPRFHRRSHAGATPGSVAGRENENIWPNPVLRPGPVFKI